MNKNKFSFIPGTTLNKIISVVIAVILWAYVIAEVNPVTQQTMVGIPVQLYNTESISERGLAISSGQTYTVNVVLEGKRRDMVEVTAEDIIATADLFGFGKGENTISIGVSTPDGVSIVDVRPSKIKVTVEELISATKPVEIAYAGEAAEGFEPGAIALYPTEIEVTGAESTVKSIAAVRVTLDIEDLDTSLKTIKIKPAAVDAAGAQVDNVKLSAESINVSGMMMSTKEVLLAVDFIGEMDPLYEIKYIDVPDTIKIKGDAETLKSIEVIEAEPIDISTLKTTTKFSVKPVLPEGIEMTQSSAVIQAEIGIQTIATKDFTFGPEEIAIKGLGEGLAAEIKATQIAVTISGRQDIIDGLVKEDVSPYIDLVNQTAGVGNFKVFLESAKTVDKMTSRPAAVYVIISESN